MFVLFSLSQCQWFPSLTSFCGKKGQKRDKEQIREWKERKVKEQKKKHKMKMKLQCPVTMATDYFNQPCIESILSS